MLRTPLFYLVVISVFQRMFHSLFGTLQRYEIIELYANKVHSIYIQIALNFSICLLSSECTFYNYSKKIQLFFLGLNFGSYNVDLQLKLKLFKIKKISYGTT